MISAHKLLSSVFHKRIFTTPQPQSPQTPPISSDVNMGSADELQETAPTVLSKENNISNLNEVSELEQILKQRTFTRSEIDRLTALLQSRTSVDSTVSNGEKEIVAVGHGNLEECAFFTPLHNRTRSPRLFGEQSTAFGRSQVFGEDAACPIELAKAYMETRTSKVCKSTLSLRTRAPREDSPLLRNSSFHSNSSVPKFSARDYGPVTPRSLGRSAIHRMVGKPCSRIYPSTFKKDSGFRTHEGTKETTLKRRSSALDDDFGSTVHKRRICQKSNILSSKSFDASASLTDSVVSKSHREKLDQDVLVSGFPPVPSQSDAVAQRILQELDKLVSTPKHKSSQPNLGSTRRNSTSTLTTQIMSEQHPKRRLENLDSLKFPENVQDDIMLVHSVEAKAQESFKRQDTFDDNDPKRYSISIAQEGVDVTARKKDAMLSSEACDSDIVDTVPQAPLERPHCFQMSVHEDNLDLKDDEIANETIEVVSVVEEGKSSKTASGERKSISSEDTTFVESPVSAGEAHLVTDGEKPSVAALDSAPAIFVSSTSILGVPVSSITSAAAPSNAPAIYGSSASTLVAPVSSITSAAVPSNAPAAISGSSASTSIAPVFSITPAAVSVASPSTELPLSESVLGDSPSVSPAIIWDPFANYNDSLGLEHSRAQDAVQSATPEANPFQFGSAATAYGATPLQLQNPATQLYQSPFNAVENFAVGRAEDDKSAWKVVRTKRNLRRRKR